TLYARPAIALSLPTPTGLSATQPNVEFQKTVSLFWLDMTAYDEAISGYRIYRRQVSRKAKSDFKPLLDSLLPAEQNYLTDTTLLEFGVYEYAVQAFGRFESKSTMSAPVQVEYKKLPLAPPADVRAAATTEGVKITWGETVQERLSGYRLYRYERGKTPTVLATLQPDQQEFLDKSAKKGALYFYFITSLEKEGESAPSEEVGVRP
ncbi:MAG: fibronectin type III domain-containing protein, partial [Candidatus Thermochlorobacter sp.]